VTGSRTQGKLRQPFLILWSLLVGGFLLAFAIIEYVALKDGRKGDTLTEHVRAAIRYPLLKAMFGTVWLWLAFHFLSNSNWPFG